MSKRKVKMTSGRPAPLDWDLKSMQLTTFYPDEGGKVYLYAGSGRWAMAWETHETNDENKWFAWGGGNSPFTTARDAWKFMNQSLDAASKILDMIEENVK